MGETGGLVSGTGAVTEDVQGAREREVEEVAELLRNAVGEGGTGMPLTELLDGLHRERGISRSLLREALSRVLYSGRVALTEDRRVVAG